jgi:hypothetical protein
LPKRAVSVWIVQLAAQSKSCFFFDCGKNIENTLASHLICPILWFWIANDPGPKRIGSKTAAFAPIARSANQFKNRSPRDASKQAHMG